MYESVSRKKGKAVLTERSDREGDRLGYSPTETTLLSPLSLLVWGKESAADTCKGADWISGRCSVMKMELKSSLAAAQFLALALDWNWAEILLLGPISAKLCFDLKLTWATVSLVRSQDENSFSSSDGPREVNEQQTFLQQASLHMIYFNFSWYFCCELALLIFTKNLASHFLYKKTKDI